MIERRGWCPGVFDPMPSGDGLLVRIKPPAPALSAGAAVSLAEAASRYGSGVIQLTSRANLLVRGLSAASALPFADAMVACGLASADRELERRRIVTVSPLVGDDPSLAPETAAIAAEIESGLAADRHLAALPAKFAIVVDGGGVLPINGLRADISARAVDGGFALSVDAGGEAAMCEAMDVPALALGLARGFLDLAAALRKPPRRMRELVRELGTEAIFSAARFACCKFVMAGPDPAIHDLGAKTLKADARVEPAHDDRAHANSVGPANHPVLRNCIGFLPYSTLGRGAFGVGVPFGTQAPMLARLAELALRFGDWKLRISPWRVVLVGGVGERNVAALHAAAAELGMIVDPSDPRLRVIACAGLPGCSSASVDAPADAALLARSLRDWSGTVHVSGCEKGCAHPGAATFTLVGKSGHYDLVRDGSARQSPVGAGLRIEEACELIRQEVAA